MNLFRGDNDRSLRTRLHNIECHLIQLEDGEKKVCDVLIVRLLIKAKVFDVYKCLFELVYKKLDCNDAYLANHAREGQLSLGCSSP